MGRPIFSRFGGWHLFFSRALETLAAVLPVVQRQNLPLFDDSVFRDSIRD
jgi:hypothetical protein